ncbi:MAG: aconitase/3-isopropylmalate dehydratase large subunit family protein [Chloroflexota bacterium]
MGETLAQKVLARTAGRDVVQPGEFVWAQPDVIWLNEGNFLREVDNLRRAGLDVERRVTKKVFETIDHDIPGSSQASSDRKKRIREVGREYGIRIYDIGRSGISHQFGAETGDIAPGMLVLATDVHITTLGGIGALAIPISRGTPFLLAAGKTWLRVPETVKVEVSGKMAPWMASRDIAQWLIAQIGDARADYQVLEFCGDLIKEMPIDGRLTLCNVAVETSCKAGVVPFDDITKRYFDSSFEGREFAQWWPVTSDSDAQYSEHLRFDVTDLEPIIALPPSPDNVRPLGEVLGMKIDHAYIGSCAGGRMEDLRMVASVLKGRKVADTVRMFIVPSSQRIYAKAAKEGLLEIFVEAGASVMAPACSLCYGMQGALSSGEVRICTATRNDPGRMGSPEAKILLTGPATVAASAVKGSVADPRDFVS